MRLHIVDVFAETRYAGNQLAVVRDCAALSAETMQTIAREMNFSETTFVTAESADRARVRIFTPGEELPFAGHPTIGTAWVLGHTRPSFTLELAVGNVEVNCDGAAGVAWMTPPKPTLGERFPADRAAKLLQLGVADLDPRPAVAIRLHRSEVRVRRRSRSRGAQARASRRNVLSRVHRRGLTASLGVPVRAAGVFEGRALLGALVLRCERRTRRPGHRQCEQRLRSVSARASREAYRCDRGAGVRDQATVAALFACRWTAVARWWPRAGRVGGTVTGSLIVRGVSAVEVAQVLATEADGQRPKTAAPRCSVPSANLASVAAGRSARSLARRNSPSALPVQAESRFGAPAPELRSPRLTVRKSTLNRVRPDVFGTLECNCAAENRIRPPGGQMRRTVGVRSCNGSLRLGTASRDTKSLELFRGRLDRLQRDAQQLDHVGFILRAQPVLRLAGIVVQSIQ